VKRTKNLQNHLGLLIDQRLALLNPLHLDIELTTFPEFYVTQEENDFANSIFEFNGIDHSKDCNGQYYWKQSDKSYPQNTCPIN
jgi:heptosyltransferase-2